MGVLFIHVGGDIILRSKEIIFILNQDIRDIPSDTLRFLEMEEKKKEKVVISKDYIKSIIITNDKIYYSPVSTLTLNKRSLVNVDPSLDVLGDVEESHEKIT